MSCDNWEKRFDEVVRETERNLAKVKGTLQQPTPKFSFSQSKYTTSCDIRRSPLLELNKPSELEIKQNSSLSDNTPKSYQHQIWKQDDEITKLRKKISLLEQSNIHYEQETKLLKSQVSSLKSKLNTKHPDPPANISRQFEIFKNEMYKEMKSLKQQIRHNDSSLPDNEIYSIRKDVDSNRNRVAEDLHETRNELECLRNRLMKVEVEVRSTMTESKETQRRCQSMSNEMGHLRESTRIQTRATSSQLQSLSESCAHLGIIRNSVSDMQGRISSLESGSLSGRLSNLRNDSATPCSGKESTRGSSYISGNIKNKKRSKFDKDMDISLGASLEDLSMLSDEEITLDDEITLDNTISTFRHGNTHNKSIAETISFAGDILSDISGLLSDDDDDKNFISTDGNISD